METDPFDGRDVFPFVAEMYFGDDREPIVIWDNDYTKFAQRLYDAIESLPGRYIFYAHNGGKFDWMFLLPLLRGDVSFKGRAIMSAKIGKHELRDSLHIIPTKLASYAKDEFDYTMLTRANRQKNKRAILKYLHSDCVNLYEIVTDFAGRFGNVISIGQAAMNAIKETVKFEALSPASDEFMRRYFFGGRTECIQGPGIFHGDFVLYDVNSMYPGVMANSMHPISADFSVEKNLTARTAFVELSCTNHGALVSRDENGALTPNIARGTFYTTIHEFRMAMKLGLISDVRIISTVNFSQFGNFAQTILPLYDEKQRLTDLRDGGDDSRELARQILFVKFLLNNAYGKFAQNPRRFKDHHITAIDGHPNGEYNNGIVYPDNGFPWKRGDSCLHDYDDAMSYQIWERNSGNERFNNVATAASITGAARAIMMQAIATAVNPLYCDTDSLICSHLPGAETSNELGAWKIEDQIIKLCVAGKKLYGYETKGREIKVRAKGVKNLTINELETIVGGAMVSSESMAPTIKKSGEQVYTTRRIKMTCPFDYKSRLLDVG